MEVLAPPPDRPPGDHARTRRVAQRDPCGSSARARAGAGLHQESRWRCPRLLGGTPAAELDTHHRGRGASRPCARTHTGKSVPCGTLGVDRTRPDLLGDGSRRARLCGRRVRRHGGHAAGARRAGVVVRGHERRDSRHPGLRTRGAARQATDLSPADRRRRGARHLWRVRERAAPRPSVDGASGRAWCAHLRVRRAGDTPVDRGPGACVRG